MAQLSLNKARVLVRKTLEAGKEKGFNPLTAVVLDEGGHVIAVERQDGATPGRFFLAQGKAYGSVMLGMGGRAQTAAALDRPFFISAVNGALDGKMVPVAGGVLLRDKKGAIVGALGVSGDTSDNDAEAALVGVEAAGLVGEA